MIQHDIGPYADLKPRLRLEAPKWLKQIPGSTRREPKSKVAFRFVQGVAVEVTQQESAQTSSIAFDDPDGDDIPNSLDILIGAKKTVLLATPYVETYRVIDFPNGDMPRDEGVCTDVIVRALRNAGYDLQALIQTDRRATPAAYPAIQRPDPNIDHRRVRNVVVYFRRHVLALPVKRDATPADYFPGDILFFDTLGDSRPDHVGIVSDRVGPSQWPLIINSWTTGYTTLEMDLLGSVRVTDHFRMR